MAEASTSGTTSKEPTFFVEEILNDRYNSKKKRREYLIKWQNYPPEQNTWEPARNVMDPELIKEYNEKKKEKNGKQKKVASRSPSTISTNGDSINEDSPISAVTATLVTNGTSRKAKSPRSSTPNRDAKRARPLKIDASPLASPHREQVNGNGISAPSIEVDHEQIKIYMAITIDGVTHEITNYIPRRRN